MLRDYEVFFGRHAHLRPATVVEVGMWDGGSLALWNELLSPSRVVGVDLRTDGAGEYLRRYVEAHAPGQIAAHWGVDQADESTMRSILAPYAGTIDLVIDDASHLYAPTRATFETVFPLTSPRGLYVIEDWAWEHWRAYSGANATWADERAMADVIHEIVRYAASSPAVASVTVYKDFVAIERSDAPMSPARIDLDREIRRRQIPLGTKARIAARRARAVAGRIRRRVRG